MNKEQIAAFFDSDKGGDDLKRFKLKIDKEVAFEERWLNKFENYLINVSDDKLTLLYKSILSHDRKRQDILYKQSIDGQSSLLDHLFNLFRKLGKEGDGSNFGMFTSAMFDWRGYRMELICGQGCFYSISKNKIMTELKNLNTEAELEFLKKFTRFEVINHNSPRFEIGRVLVYRGDIEVSLQDDGKTLKIFI